VQAVRGDAVLTDGPWSGPCASSGPTSSVSTLPPREVHVPCIDCGRPGVRSRCPSCTRSRRGTTTERGYGHAYQVERAAVLAEATHCSICEEPFTEDNPATGGHLVAIRDGGTLADGIGPHCRRCNYGWRRTGA